MLKLLFLVASGLLVLTTAHVLVPRQASTTTLNLCTDREAAVVPGSVIEVKTPHFGNGNYADNTRCNVRLHTGSEAVLLNVKVQTLYLEAQQNCLYDSICINGVQFCGANWAAGRDYQYIVPADNTFTLDFKTDGSVTQSGAFLTITATAYKNESVSIANSGYGSSNTSIGFSTYSLPSYIYTDTCGIDASRTTYSYYTTTYTTWYDQTTYNYQYTTDYFYTTTWYYPTTYDYQYTTDYYYTTPYNPWYYQTTYDYQYTTDYYYTTTYNPWYYQTTYDYQYTTGYYYTTPYNPWYYQTTYDYQYSTDYYYTTTYNPWYYQTTYDYQYTTDYYYSTTYNPWYYQTTYDYQYTTDYYYTTTYNPWYYPTTYGYQYTTDYYYTTPYNLWYYQTTYDYQYTTGYYYTTPYYPYNTWYYDTTTYNPCQNGYTTVYCQYTSSSPSSMNDYIAYELQRALQEINSERSSQDQLYAILANLLRYLGHK